MESVLLRSEKVMRKGKGSFKQESRADTHNVAVPKNVGVLKYDKGDFVRIKATGFCQYVSKVDAWFKDYMSEQIPYGIYVNEQLLWFSESELELIP